MQLLHTVQSKLFILKKVTQILDMYQVIMLVDHIHHIHNNNNHYQLQLTQLVQLVMAVFNNKDQPVQLFNVVMLVNHY